MMEISVAQIISFHKTLHCQERELLVQREAAPKVVLGEPPGIGST